MKIIKFVLILSLLAFGCRDYSSNKVEKPILEKIHKQMVYLSKYDTVNDDGIGVRVLSDTIISGLSIRTGLYMHNSPDSKFDAYVQMCDKDGLIMLDTVYKASSLTDTTLYTGENNWSLFSFDFKYIKNGNLFVDAIFFSNKTVNKDLDVYGDSLLYCEVYVDMHGRLTKGNRCQKIYHIFQFEDDSFD